MSDHAVPLLLVMAVALGVSGWRFYRVLRPVLVAPPAARWDQPWARLKGVFVDVGLHRRLLRRRYSGTLHALVFCGFVVLFSAIVQAFGSGLFAGFTLSPIGGETWIASAQDLFAVLILIGLGMALYQRVVLRPARFEGSNQTDAYLIYGLVLLVVATMVMEAACRFVALGSGSPWRPLTSAIAGGLSRTGLAPAQARTGEEVFYWLHVAAVLGFLIYIPGSKHRHIFTGIPNVFFRNLRPKGQLAAPPAGQAQSGIGDIGAFDWKHKLDLLSCTECGRCQAVCPAYAAGLPLSPKSLIMDLRDYMIDRERGSRLEEPLIGGAIEPATLWACTTCRACVDSCPIHIEQMPKIIDMRRGLVEEGKVEPMLQDALSKLQRTGNSQGLPARQRAKWTKDLGFKVKDARKQPVDVLWFVGDYASYDPRAQRVTQKVARLLQEAGVDFGILYEAEQNSGNDVRRVGEEGTFETLAQANIAAIAGCTFGRIMTTDPHSLNALRQEYRAFGFAHDVMHYTELLLELLASGRLKPAAEAEGAVVTYHDPCYLGRYNGGFDAPRELIRRSGYALHEMGRNRDNSFCCGAGGGRIWMDDSAMTERPSENRIREALTLGDASIFVVSCPKDTVMYTAAVQALGVADRIRVRDVVDLIQPADVDR